MTLKLRFKFKYFFKSVLRLLIQSPHSCIDGVPSYLAQWLLMKCSLKPRFHIADVTLKSTSKSHLQKPIYSPYWEFLCHFLNECSYLKEWLPMVCCLFDLILFIPVNIFSVMSGWLLLGWNGTKQDLMCLACHVFFLLSCGHLFGKGWPLCSLVYDVFLCLYHLPTLCHGSCVELDFIDSWSLPFSLLCSRTICSSPCEAQTRNPSISTQTLYHWILHSHILWWLRWKFQITAMTLE